MYNPYAKLTIQAPAIPYGLAAWIGSLIASTPSERNLLYISFALSLLLFYQTMYSKILRWKVLLIFAVAFIFYVYVHSTYAFPQTPLEGTTGQGHLHIDQLYSRTTHFGKQWVVQGKLLGFQSPTLKFHQQLPVTLTLPSSIQRPLANQDYWVEGKLILTKNYKYIFLVDKQSPWYPIEGTWSFAEYRLQAKQAVNKYIYEYFKSPQSKAFLSGIATGMFDDRLMIHEFNRFGLQHIMAISGFHFAIIAGVFGAIFNYLFGKRTAAILLGLLMTAYFIFLGATPSILRAWTMCLIGLVACVIERPTSGLNALGVAMIATLAYDPLLCQSLGFQFTFGITGALFLLYPPIDSWMQNWFKKRSLGQALRLTAVEKYAYIILAIFRQGLSLTLAVNSIALPITLFYFEQFPLMSLLYNLFFPFFVSISMLLLVAGVLLRLLFQSLGNGIHFINDVYTHYLLQFTYNTPKSLDYMIRVEEISGALVTGIIIAILMAGVYFSKYRQGEIFLKSG